MFSVVPGGKPFTNTCTLSDIDLFIDMTQKIEPAYNAWVHLGSCAHYYRNLKMDQPKILVAIRKRPLSKKEQSKGETDIITVKNRETIIVSQYKQKVDLTKYLEETVFNFDFAFNQQTNNQQIYEAAVRPLVDSAFMGAKVTCFAYGQTGSGKTFTMNGNQKMGVLGLYTLGAHDIFAYLKDNRFRHLTAKLSFFEIYCGKLFDLLNKRTELTLREDNKSNINIIGLEEIPVDSLQKFQQLLSYGSVQRITSQNSANAESSRSHAILQITLKQGKKIFGKVSFIDLAGNERGADHTDMKKQTRIDGAEINKSLLSLKECIRALDQGKGHTPFRGSKLTMVLKDSFVGYCRTVMIGNVSPSSASSQNTLNTLRYADRVKQLRKPSESLTKQELKAREMMLPRQNNNAIKIEISKDDDAEDIQAKRMEAQRNYGIKNDQQMPKQPREMSSDQYRKGLESDRGRQQSFGPTSNTGRAITGLQKQATLQPVQINSQTQPVIAPKSPSVSANITKIDMKGNRGSVNYPGQGQMDDSAYQAQKGNQGRGAPDTRMDIERPQQMSYSQVMPQQNNYMSNNPGKNFNSYQNSQYPQQGNQQYPQQGNQQYQQQGSQQYQQQYPQQGSPYNNGYPQQYPSQQPYHQQAYQYNNVMANKSSVQADRLGQYRSNYQAPDPRQPSRGPAYKPVSQKQLIPQDFQGMIEFVSTSPDPALKQSVHQKLHEYLFHEQNDLIASHSDTLRSSLDYLKSEMSLISDLQNNRDAVSTREYLNIMQDSIDEKISLLEMLREKMVQFTYKLERVEEIDEQNEGRRGGEDQQLLDDIH